VGKRLLFSAVGDVPWHKPEAGESQREKKPAAVKPVRRSRRTRGSKTVAVGNVPWKK